MKSTFTLLILLFIIISCDEGLAPIESEVESRTGFGGTVTFIGEWPADITQTNIVLFQDPLSSEEDFNIVNLKYLSTSIPFGVSEYEYNTVDSILFGNVTAGEYAFLAVAQTTKEEISLERKDWFVVGIYYDNDDLTTPGEVIVEENKFKDNFNIICDFSNPPPQPPGGN